MSTVSVTESSLENIASAIRAKNGQYKARERDGVAGYTAVFVHVPLNKITGIDPTDGKTYEVKLDAQGNLTRRLIEE